MYVMQQNKHWNFKRSSNTSTSFLSPSTLLRSIEFSGVCWVLFATTEKTKTQWNRWTSLSVVHTNLVLAVIFFYHLSKRNPFPETSAELLISGEREFTVMPTPQPCNWMTYAITVCQHAKILTTHTMYVTNSQRTSVGILR